MKTETVAKSAKAVFEAIFESEIDDHSRRAIIYSCIMTESIKEGKTPKEMVEALMGDELKWGESEEEKDDVDDDSKEKAEAEIIADILKSLNGRSMLDIMAIIGVVVKTVMANTPISTDEFFNTLIGMPEG